MRGNLRILIVLFMGALIPLSTAAWAASINATETSTPEVANQTLSSSTSNITTNETNTTITMAYNMLVIVDNVANYTTGLMADLRANNSTIPNETLELYIQAEELRAQAWELYNAANYSESINASMSALYLYKEVVEELTEYYKEHGESKMESEEEYYGLALDAKEELQRSAEYFPYAERVIEEGRSEGIDVTPVEELYNATKAAYTVVAQDIANGNLTALEGDLEYAKELKDKLEDAIEELSEQIVDARAEEISQTFVEKLQGQMVLMQELISTLQNSTVNSTDLQENLEELQAMYEEFNALVEEGQYEEALDMLHDINDELKDIIEETREIEKEYHKEKEEWEEDEDHEEKEEKEERMEKDEEDTEQHGEYSESDTPGDQNQSEEYEEEQNPSDGSDKMNSGDGNESDDHEEGDEEGQ
ncbi:HsdR family type I site-specific deoxyribonuclease [Palaeococcus ferrophilus]|uniref:hypothetical protein n=1 Tax=Palaeococcus ferrophilus TaxID=83868 RepID=UPI00064FE14C|nr:hypothetical protein [Palaeococcus ferrophilus]